MPHSDDKTDKLILEHIEWDLRRLATQANAIGQGLLAYMIDMARLEAQNARNSLGGKSQ
jgi:hypothetical protein